MALLSPPTIGPGPLSPRDAAELSRALKDMYRLMGNLSVSPPLQLSMGSAGSVLSLNGDGFMSSSEALEVKTTNPGTGDSDVDVLNVTVIQIDQASGLQEVDNGSGNVTLQAQDASATHSGVVNLSAQTLGVGPKVFVVDSSATFGSTTIGIASTTGAAVILLGIGGIGVAKSQGTMRVESPDAANFSIFSPWTYWKNEDVAGASTSDAGWLVLGANSLTVVSQDHTNNWTTFRNAVYQVVDNTGAFLAGVYGTFTYLKDLLGTTGTITVSGGLVTNIT